MHVLKNQITIHEKNTCLLPRIQKQLHECVFLKKYICILASTGFESHILFSSSLNVLEAKGALPNKHSVLSA